MFPNIDLLIVGAGPVGCVVAERASSQMGWRSLIVEKRNHVGGNCYDRFHESGILIHQYGPHYFRTNNLNLLNYLSQFTEWIPGNYIVKSFSQGQLFPFPINLTTLELFFNRSFSQDEAQLKLETLRQKIEHPDNSEEFVLSRVGKELYEAFYLGYTLKQWDQHPRDLAPSVCGRIPVRFNRDERYVNHRFQLTPKNGFTKLFENMIRLENIHVLLNTEYSKVKPWLKPKVATIYCGPIDEYFDYCYGKLPWRSLDFEFKSFNKDFLQPCVQINYPNDFLYTRSVEIKHVTQQDNPRTVISYEYSKSIGDPYYPVPAEGNEALYKRYKLLADHERISRKVYFAGRLAQYKYMNTDEAVEEGLSLFQTLREEVHHVDSSSILPKALGNHASL